VAFYRTANRKPLQERNNLDRHGHDNSRLKKFASAAMISSAKRVHKLEIHLESFDAITDKGLNYISENLKRMPSLKNISLSIYQCVEITDEGLKYLAQGLERLPRLPKNHFKDLEMRQAN